MAIVLSTADFIGSIGVNAKPNFTNSDYRFAFQAAFAADYLGIEHIRVPGIAPGFTPISQTWLNYKALTDAGMKLTMLIGSVSPSLVQSAVASAAAFSAANGNAVVAIEGVNEPGATYQFTQADGTVLVGQAAALAQVAALVGAVNASPLAGVDLYGQSGFNVDDAADFSNGHPYVKFNGDQPFNRLSSFVTNRKAISDEGIVITETGYATVVTTPAEYNPNDPWEGVDGITQAKLTLNTLFDAKFLGIERTFIYQLFDEYEDLTPGGVPINFNLGLFDISVDTVRPGNDASQVLESAKPAAVAIHNLTSILNANDIVVPGGAAATYTITGLSPANGRSLELVKSLGAQDIVIWAEPDIWDQDSDTPIVAAATTASIDFGSKVVSARIYDPLVGKAIITSFDYASLVNVDVVDHPLIVEIVATGNRLTGTDAVNRLIGGAGHDLLLGLAGNDTLDGGLGADRLEGGLGNDTFVVDDSRDLVIEALGAGTELVKAGASFTLGDNVEKLTLTGTADINGTGNDLKNIITGNAGANILDGNAGRDTLRGNAGADVFVLDVLGTTATSDVIADFATGVDTIQLSLAAFAALAGYGAGSLDAGELVFGTKATAAGQFLIYNPGTGGLFYDADGLGGALQIQLAVLSGRPALDAADIFLI